MARKKKTIEVIEGLMNEDKALVSKSLPLFALWKSDITLAEFKILDTYLSRIDSHHPEKRMVVFEKGEIEKLLGVKKINTPTLEKRLKNLMQVVKIDDVSEKKGFRLVALFEEAIAEKDEDEQWIVKMCCTEKAMKYIFNIENLGYLRYKLRCITSLASRYSYVLFTYLEHNRFRKSWEIGVDELKAMLNCAETETYKAFKDFNKLVLKKAYEEINEKTECKFEYTPIKRGRNVAEVRFEVKTLPKVCTEDVDANQMTIEDYLSAEEEEEIKLASMSSEERKAYLDKQIREAWKEELPVGWFSEDEIELIAQLLYTIPEHVLPSDRYADISQQRAMYVREKILTMKMYDGKQTIKNKFKYIEKILREDA